MKFKHKKHQNVWGKNESHFNASIENFLKIHKKYEYKIHIDE